MLHVSEKTDPGMLPQSQALESTSADNPLGRDETGCGRPTAPGVQLGREERHRKVSVTPSRSRGEGVNRVFVLDKRGNPLMPCHPARARKLLAKGRAKVARHTPFTIRLIDRKIEDSEVQPVRLGVDPGSRTTGIAVSRDDQGTRHVLFRLEIQHRSQVIVEKMQQRANYRRRRRSKNLRYRAPRFNNRTKPKGWLAPSLRSRVQHVDTWAHRLAKWCPVSIIDFELVRFDTQKMQNPDIQGGEYQRGTLYGTEVRQYVLHRDSHRCVYCDAGGVPLNLDHVLARSRGGSNRPSNLVASCVPCNLAKGASSVAEFAPERAARILARVKTPLKDAAAVNSTRNATLRALRSLGLPVECSTGGRTKWNRMRLGVPKTHALDAACVGVVEKVEGWAGPTHIAKATGRGSHARVRSDKYGFPRLRLPRIKQVHGFATGDLVRSDVPDGLKTSGTHTGRVAVRTKGSFRVGATDGINHKYCRLVQRADGYDHKRLGLTAEVAYPSPRINPGVSRRQDKR